MEPIIKLAQSCINNDLENVINITTAIGVTLTQEEKELRGKPLLKSVMMKWLNAGETILNMVVEHLPSPSKAQKYRTQYLYTGENNDKVSQSMKQCDPYGPLIVYVSKMVPTKDKSRFIGIGRVFSGTLSAGMKVQVLGHNYV